MAEQHSTQYGLFYIEGKIILAYYYYYYHRTTLLAGDKATFLWLQQKRPKNFERKNAYFRRLFMAIISSFA